MTTPPTVSIVQAEFNNCVFNQNISTLVVTNGTIVADTANQLQMIGTFQFTTLKLSDTTLEFDNNTNTGTINGTIMIPILPQSTTSSASLIMDNFTGAATISWSGGGQTLSPGQKVNLDGLP